MTKEQYKEQVAEIDEQIAALKAEKEYVLGEYFRTNATYKIGDRLMAQRNGKQEKNDVMITGYSDRWGAITYLSKKVKKDGTLSLNDCWFTDFDDTTYEVVELGYGQRKGFINRPI
jgi:hypothetical protein